MNAPWQQEAYERGLDEPRWEIHCALHGRQTVPEPEWFNANDELHCPLCLTDVERERRVSQALDRAEEALRTSPGVVLLEGREIAVANLALWRVLSALDDALIVGELRAAVLARLDTGRAQ